MKLRCCNILITGIFFGIIAQIVHTICAFLGRGYYTNKTYLPLWSKIMMPGGGAPGANFYITSVVFAIIIGMLITLVYTKVKKGVPGKDLKKGLFYGWFLFLVAGVPGYLSTTLILAVPQVLLIMWLFENLAIYLLGGMVVAKLN